MDHPKVWQRYEVEPQLREIGVMVQLSPDKTDELAFFLDHKIAKRNHTGELLMHIVASTAIELMPEVTQEQAEEVAAVLTAFMQKEERFGGKLIKWVAHPFTVKPDESDLSAAHLCIVGAQSDMEGEVFFPAKYFEIIARAYYAATQQKIDSEGVPFRLPQPTFDITI